MKTAQVTYAGRINVERGDNPRELYAHQNEAIQFLDDINKNPFEGLLVLPTGGGKTLTAVHWLLRNFINNQKKVLWIAHRHELLDQALETVKLSAYPSVLNNVSGFRFRIISGHPKHGRPVHIEPSDDIIIASKDSLNSGLEHLLNNWVRHLPEVLLVVDEAHHATAKTYRKLINAVKDEMKSRGHENGFRMLGLTATPFRTDEGEQGLLKLVFPGDIIFKEDLRNLINKGILAEPIFENLETKIPIKKKLTARDIKTIEDFDKLPKDVAEQIAKSYERNRIIVSHYLNNRKKYKPLLIFAIDVIHAIALNKLFRDEGINSDYVVAAVKDANTGASIDVKNNKEKIQKFRNGELEVLINVEILTEGTDLPNVQTVFLTRPTASTILMTQMIGRALRGQKAGGTEKAYVISFIDEWEDKINWVNPEKLHVGEGDFRPDGTLPSNNRTARLISIEMIEEFTRIMDESIDTTGLEALEFLKRVPIGIYRFSILETAQESEAFEPIPRNYEVLLYDDTEETYDNFVNDLKILFQGIDLKDREILTKAELEYLLQTAKQIYFPNCQTLLGYRDEDVENILRFYAHTGEKPEFLAFSERRKCDLSIVARHIYDNSLGGRAKSDYIDSLWNDRKSFWQVLFSYNKLYFRKQLDIETLKIEGLYPNIEVSIPTVIHDNVPIEKLTLYEIKERDIDEYMKIKKAVFAKHTDAKGFITCAITRFRSQMRRDFQIDHIKPMSEGGLTTVNNLQVLSRKAHTKKTASENTKR
ncbi:DEAD/DEAH box helicase family protein [Anabaena sp. CCY 9402-a]|uniref:DEAD/DEAH box helicase family protein n=1 Tax=Anabaena sp. CCY 9402-a TaxID=3103867 RepID=UPI0039C6EF3B